jgi:antitoxin component YwqK of YwqJK toxin-antitoxin module
METKINQFNENGQREGLWVFHNNYCCYQVEIGYFKAGIPVGIWVGYDNEGNLQFINKISYRDNKQYNHWKEFDKSGKLIEIAEWHKDLPLESNFSTLHGLQIKINKSSGLKTKAIYVDGIQVSYTEDNDTNIIEEF